MFTHERVGVDTADPVLVARQVIMDRHRHVFGYELLYRSGADAGTPDATSTQVATARILCDALTAIGLDVLTDGKLAFINIDRQTLLNGVPATLPPERVVFEFDVDVTPTPDVLAACRELRRQGFSLAINAHPDLAITAGLLPVVDYVKIDSGRPDLDSTTLSGLLTLATHPIVTIAKHVETQAHFAKSAELGFNYFQGFFFGQPVVKEGRAIPGPQLARLKLVQTLQDPNLSIDEIEALIKHDAALCYRVLRTVNAAVVAHRGAVGSIREALLLVGREPIRRWAALLAFADSSSHAPSELLTLSAIRARFCELLAETAGHADASEAFLMGLCSLLDAILGRPMPDILAELPIPDNVRCALLGENNHLRTVLECATAYGAGEWERAAELAGAAGADQARLQTFYVQALRWARELRAATR